MPDDLKSQIEPLNQLIEALGYPLIRIPGYEADDVIGALAKLAEQSNHEVLISTSDKDLAQLVTESVHLINTMSKKRLDIAGVEEKFGVLPCQIIDLLSLTGDTSDNIPGIPGVGPKTAVKWLNEYKNLDNLIQNADKIGGKIGEKLRNNLNSLPLYTELVTIKTDIEDPRDS